MRLDHLLSKEKEVIERLPYFEIGNKTKRRREKRESVVVRFSGTERTLEWGCSSAGRAPALQAGGQGFDSLHLHHGEEKRTDGDTCEIWAHSSDG